VYKKRCVETEAATVLQASLGARRNFSVVVNEGFGRFTMQPFGRLMSQLFILSGFYERFTVKDEICVCVT
jgi:hypothetical protein